MAVGLIRVWDEFWDEFLCWVFFFFLINCVGVLGLHDGDGGDEW